MGQSRTLYLFKVLVVYGAMGGLLSYLTVSAFVLLGSIWCAGVYSTVAFTPFQVL